MSILIRKEDPNVHYNGKTLPKDAVKYDGDPPVNPSIPYDGRVLPEQAIKAQPPKVDLSNLPQFVFLGTLSAIANPYAGFQVGPPPVTGASLQNGGIVLPADVTIRGDWKKVIPSTPILDGVEVTMHIRRRPNIITFEFTCRAYSNNDWVFAQDFLSDLYSKIYLPSSVIYVQNTLLNKQGITQLVVEEGSMDTVRGNINIPMTLTFKENIPGKSLII